MNYLFRMLRIFVCLYFGFSSTASYADKYYGLNEFPEGAEDSYLIERAWKCDPIFHAEKIVDWEYIQRDENSRKMSLEESKAKLSKTLLELRGCPDEGDQVRDAFINAYVTVDYDFPGLFGISAGNIYKPRFKTMVTVAPYEMNRTGNSLVIHQAIVHPSFLIDQRNQEKAKLQLEAEQRAKLKDEEAKLAAAKETILKLEQEEAEKKEALRVRIASLKNGTVPVASFYDAYLLYDPKHLADVMNSPLLRPDNALYAARVIIDGDDGELIRVKIGGHLNVWGNMENLAYAELRLTKKTINYSPRGMRIGGAIQVIGRYVQNMKYKTIAGEGKMMPVIEVTYIGDAVADETADEAEERKLGEILKYAK